MYESVYPAYCPVKNLQSYLQQLDPKFDRFFQLPVVFNDYPYRYSGEVPDYLFKDMMPFISRELWMMSWIL